MKRREFLGNSLALSGCLAFLGVPKLLSKPRQNIVKKVIVDRIYSKGFGNGNGHGFVDYLFHLKNLRCFKCGENGTFRITTTIYEHDPPLGKADAIRMLKGWQNEFTCTKCNANLRIQIHPDCQFIDGQELPV